MRSDGSATLSLLVGRANGLLGLSCASCDGRLTNGDCLSGDSSGEPALAGGWKPFVGDIAGDAALTVDGEAVTGVSGLLNGDARAETDIAPCECGPTTLQVEPAVVLGCCVLQGVVA